MVEYRAIIHNAKNGNERVESIWVGDKEEAERIGENGLDFYGGTHFTIEDDSVKRLEDDLLLVKNDLTRSILKREIEVFKVIGKQNQTVRNPIGKSKFGIREIEIID